jgi:hypothetical protein
MAENGASKTSAALEDLDATPQSPDVASDAFRVAVVYRPMSALVISYSLICRLSKTG